jgi:hypothetical protein
MDNLKVKGEINLKIYGVDGKLRDETTISNLIVNVGKAQITALMGGFNTTSFGWLAVGTSNTAPAASQTTLVAEITTNSLGRGASTNTQQTTTTTNDTLQMVKTWTASGSSTIEEIAFFNASSSGVMGGRALTGTKSLINGEGITATYKVILS